MIPLARGERLLLAGLVLAALGFRVALVFAIPPTEAPDESAHLRYVEHLARTHSLPVQEPPEFERINVHWDEFHQPPLAYLFFLPLDRLVRGDAAPGVPHLRALRLQNTLYGAALVVLGYLAVALVTPAGDPRRFLVAATLSFAPCFAAPSAVLNNDALANLLVAAAWMPLLRPDARTRDWVLAGALLGAACLTKLTAVLAAPAVFLVPLLLEPRRWRRALVRACVAGAVGVALVSPWLLRNVALYGDPLASSVGLVPWSSVWEARPEVAAAYSAPSLLLARIAREFWGAFGWVNQVVWMPGALILTALAGLALIGWVLPTGRSGDAFEAHAPGLLAVSVLHAAALAFMALTYMGMAQGRYLQPSALPVAMLLAGGCLRPLPPRWRARATAGLTLVLIGIAAGLRVHLGRAWD